MMEYKRYASVVTDGDLIYYYTDFFVEDGVLVVVGDKNYLLTDGRYLEHAKKFAKAECLMLSENPISEFLKKLEVQTVGLLLDFSSASLYKELIECGFNVVDATCDFKALSSIKTAEQISRIKRACTITETAFSNLLKFVKEGVSELDLASELEYSFKKLGGGVGFETIVAFGKNSSVPHYKTGNVKLEPNTPILIDFGSSYQGYLSDMTRTFYFGAPTSKFVNVYNAVKSAHLKALDFAKAGVKACDVDFVAREELKAHGLDSYFLHSLGHGVGVKIHEFPTISYKNQAQLKEGMVFTIEPGVYLQNEFGVRIEDTVTVKDGKCESLMTLDKDLVVIGG